MEGILKVTPQQLQNTASDLSTQASTVRNLTEAMTSLVNGMSSAWAGDAATTYTTRFNGLQDDMERIHRMIQEHVTDLNEMAANYITAEQENTSEAEALAADVIV